MNWLLGFFIWVTDGGSSWELQAASCRCDLAEVGMAPNIATLNNCIIRNQRPNQRISLTMKMFPWR